MEVSDCTWSPLMGGGVIKSSGEENGSKKKRLTMMMPRKPHKSPGTLNSPSPFAAASEMHKLAAIQKAKRDTLHEEGLRNLLESE